MQEQTGFAVPGFEVPAWASITPLEREREPQFSDAARAEQTGFAADGFASPEVTAAQAEREALEAVAGAELVMFVSANDRFTAALSDDRELGEGSRVGRWFGQHHATGMAIRAAIRCAGEYRKKHELQAVRLTVKTGEAGFAAAGIVGTKYDAGEGGKTRQIGTYALARRVVLTIERLSKGDPNPAAFEIAKVMAAIAEHEAGEGRA